MPPRPAPSQPPARGPRRPEPEKEPAMPESSASAAPFDLDRLQQLIEMMEKHGVTDVSLRRGNEQAVELESSVVNSAVRLATTRCT